MNKEFNYMDSIYSVLDSNDKDVTNTGEVKITND